MLTPPFFSRPGAEADPPRLRQKGMTLTEIMVTVAMLGVLMAVALPSFNLWMKNAQIKATAESILSGVQMARAEAVRRNTRVQIKITADTGWTVGCVTVVSGSCPASIQQKAGINDHNPASDPTAMANPPGATTVTFNAFGQVVANQASLGATLTRLTIDNAAIDADQSHEYVIAINAGGEIRMCDPNVSSSDPRACR